MYLKYNLVIVKSEIIEATQIVDELNDINNYLSKTISLYDNYKVLKLNSSNIYVNNNNLAIKNLLVNNSRV